MRKLIPALLLVLLISAVGGCGKKKPEVKKDDGKPSDYTLVADSAVSLNDSKYFTEPRVYDRTNFGIHAKASGNILIISARNKSDMDIAIYPADLAIIKGPDRRNDFVRITPASADLSQFTGVVLKTNDRAVIRLPIRDIPNMHGMRLVYNNPRQSILFPPVDIE